MSAKRERPKLQIGPLNPGGSGGLMAGFTGDSVAHTQTELPIDAVRPRPHQPRRSFSPQALERLTESIRAHGILQPLSVHRDGNGGYDLISGERRLRAARAAGLTEVPVKVFTDLTERQIGQLAAVENLQREDLNPVDEVDAVMDILAAELGLPREQLTPRLERWKSLKMRDPALARASEEERDAIARVDALFRGLSRGEWTSFVANRLPVLRLPPVLLEAVREGRLEYTKAIALRRAPEALRETLLASAGELSVQQIRQRIREEGNTDHGSQSLDPVLADFRQAFKPERLTRLSSEDQVKLAGLLKEAVALLK